MSVNLVILLVYGLGILTGVLMSWQWTNDRKRNREFDAWVRRIR